MKVDLEKLRLSVSPITGEIYVGITNKTGEKWLHKLNVSNQFYDVVLYKFLGSANKKTTEISSYAGKWDITIEKITEGKSEVEAP